MSSPFSSKLRPFCSLGATITRCPAPPRRRRPAGTGSRRRGADVSIRLSDSSVSRRHAEVRPNADGYVVVDLGPTNGTRVNGAGITERQLRDGDTISIGDSQLRFEAS